MNLYIWENMSKFKLVRCDVGPSTPLSNSVPHEETDRQTGEMEWTRRTDGKLLNALSDGQDIDGRV